MLAPVDVGLDVWAPTHVGSETLEPAPGGGFGGVRAEGSAAAARTQRAEHPQAAERHPTPDRRRGAPPDARPPPRSATPLDEAAPRRTHHRAATTAPPPPPGAGFENWAPTHVGSETLKPAPTGSGLGRADGSSAAAPQRRTLTPLWSRRPLRAIEDGLRDLLGARLRQPMACP